MKHVLTIAFNQVQRQLSERGTLITTFFVPVMMMFLIGSFNSGGQARWVFDVVRSADDPMAAQYAAMLAETAARQSNAQSLYTICDLAQPASAPEACGLKDVTVPSGDFAALTAFAANRLTETNATGGYIVVPASLSADLRAGTPSRIQIDAEGDVNRTQVLNGVVQATNTRMNGAVLAAQVATEKAGGDAALYDKVYTAAQALWASDPVQIEQVASTVTGTNAGTGFGQSAPGIGAMFVMINAMALGQLFILERKQWTMQRLMVMPVTRGQILAGKVFGQYLLCLLTYVIMLVAGTALGVRWGDPLAVIAIVLTFTLAVTAMAMALAALVRTAGQAAGIGFLIPMVLSPLGGAWWPLDITPAAMQTVGKLVSPIAWSQDAFNRMVFYGATLPDILPNVGVLLLFSAVFFAIGLLRYRYE